MGATYSDRFWKTICAYRSAVALLLGLEAVLLVLLLIALWLRPEDTETRTILVADFALVVAGFFAAGYVLYRCRKRRRTA
ncbi:hypothetical protein ACFO5R_19325 [Halosolutus amylolyticus]|uniref:Uncharacterized protein n=1 Tax=Halosolutus amylolyticus TaxID=2932267 RepID=A0ABD5PVS5_9EURY|nr:hypothetical protein [Halosolutus amylolyticus]